MSPSCLAFYRGWRFIQENYSRESDGACSGFCSFVGAQIFTSEDQAFLL
jgi:hypothetical protein